MAPPPPTNAAPAALLFLCSVVTDALTAVASVDADVPASLRSTSLALACTFAAPVLRTDAVHGYFQRPIIGILLVAVAIIGIHHGGQQTRTFDAIHTTLVGVICIFVFWRGGADESKNPSDTVKVNTSIIMVAGGFLVYASARLLRSALLIGYEVTEFSFISNHNITGAVRGVAFANSQHVFGGCATGVIGLGCGVLLTARVELLSAGTGELAMALASAGVACLVGFVSSMFGIADDQNKLKVLFGSSTCLDEQGCQAAFLSRRIVQTLPQPAAMLFLAIGLLVLAYPPALRLNSRAAAARWSWTTTGIIVGGLTGLLIWNFVIPYLDTWRGMNLSLLILTAWLSAFMDTFSGSVVASGVLISTLFGITWQFHHWCVIAVVACLVLHTVASVLNLYGTSTDMFKSAVWLFAPSLRDDVRGIDIVLGGSTVAAMSVAAYSLMLLGFRLANYGGEWDPTLGTPIEQTMNILTFYLLPAAVILPLYTCRCEVNLLSAQTRVILWTAAPLVPAFLYLLSAPTASHNPLSLPVIMALIPWASLVLV